MRSLLSKDLFGDQKQLYFNTWFLQKLREGLKQNRVQPIENQIAPKGEQFSSNRNSLITNKHRAQEYKYYMQIIPNGFVCKIIAIKFQQKLNKGSSSTKKIPLQKYSLHMQKKHSN